jgi:hypothetical protein
MSGTPRSYQEVPLGLGVRSIAGVVTIRWDLEKLTLRGGTHGSTLLCSPVSLPILCILRTSMQTDYSSSALFRKLGRLQFREAGIPDDSSVAGSSDGSRGSQPATRRLERPAARGGAKPCGSSSRFGSRARAEQPGTGQRMLPAGRSDLSEQGPCRAGSPAREFGASGSWIRSWASRRLTSAPCDLA